MPTKKTKKPKRGKCFIACPIDEPGSAIRKRSDVVRDFIIRPVLQPAGYDVIRADELPDPGIITRQVMDHLQEDPLVVADLTGNNPNVWYELAIRHAVAKPFIQIVQAGQPIPFDTKHQRTIEVDPYDPYSVELCKTEMKKQLALIHGSGFTVETPIGQALAMKALAATGEYGAMLADILAGVHQLQLNALKARVTIGQAPPGFRTWEEQLVSRVMGLATAYLRTTREHAAPLEDVVSSLRKIHDLKGLELLPIVLRAIENNPLYEIADGWLVFKSD